MSSPDWTDDVQWFDGPRVIVNPEDDWRARALDMLRTRSAVANLTMGIERCAAAAARKVGGLWYTVVKPLPRIALTGRALIYLKCMSVLVHGENSSSFMLLKDWWGRDDVFHVAHIVRCRDCTGMLTKSDALTLEVHIIG